MQQNIINKRVKINLLILLLAISINLNGQNSIIKGKAFYETSQKALDSLKVDLLDSLDNRISSVFTNSLGEYRFEGLEQGNYNIFTEIGVPFSYLFEDVLVGEYQEIDINIPIREPCQNKSDNGICPYCKNSRKVLKISPLTIVNLNFGDNKRAEKKYYKKNLKRGYRTYTNNENEKIVISMYIESEKDKFYDFCYKWFCVKCKKIF